MKSVRQINIIGVAVACALALVALVGPVRAKVAERSRMVAQHRSALLSLAEQQKVEARLDRAQKEIESLSTSIAELQRSFPPRKELDSFLSELQELARSSRADLVRVVPGDSRQGDVYSTVRVHVETRAAFDDFYRFLWGLDRMTRLSQVESLRISRDGTSDACTIQVTLCIFVSARGELT